MEGRAVTDSEVAYTLASFPPICTLSLQRALYEEQVEYFSNPRTRTIAAMVCFLMTIPSAFSHPVTAHGCSDPSGKAAPAPQQYLSGGKVDCGLRTREERGRQRLSTIWRWKVSLHRWTCELLT